jgi:hypothetical protein
MFGMVIAVMALCATAVFGASLSHLTATPALYGDDYGVSFGNTGQDGIPMTELTALEHNHAITGIMLGTSDEISIDDVSVASVAGKAVRGPLLMSTVDGRLPAGVGEVDLGVTTLRQVGAHVGSMVRVTVQVPNGGKRTASFRVVGTTSFPSEFGLGGLGTGAAFTLAGFENALCPLGPGKPQCLDMYQENENFVILARATPGPLGRAAITHLIDTYPGNAQRPIVPTSLVNFGEAVNFPLILGFMLALFGVATLLHLLVVSVARRRREIGLLKALGFVRRQVGAATCWQATTVALVGIVVGVPLGVAVGQVVWRAFATNLGVVPDSTVPVALIATLGLGVLAIANVLAVVPALAAARSTTAGQLLRTL